MIQRIPREIGFERLQVYGDDQKANEMLYGEIAVLGCKKNGSRNRKCQVK